MCCCDQPTVNGELGYKWQPNDAPMVRRPDAPELLEATIGAQPQPMDASRRASCVAGMQ
jgi:hypothetical protein